MNKIRDSDWEPIDTAPKDGTVILTTEGTARYVDPKHWGSPITRGWHLCSSSGDIPNCEEEDACLLSPGAWMTMPEYFGK